MDKRMVFRAVTIILSLLFFAPPTAMANETEPETIVEWEEKDPAILHVRLREYDLEGAVQALFGDEDVVQKTNDIGNSRVHYVFEQEGKSLISNNGKSLLYRTEGDMPYITCIGLSPWQYWTNQDVFLDMILPNDPSEMDSYDEALKTVIDFADCVDFAMSKVRSYKIDEALAEYIWKYFQMPAPGKSSKDEHPDEWEESKYGIYFVLESAPVDGYPYAPLTDDGLLKVIWTEESGIIFVNGGAMFELESADTVETIDAYTAFEGLPERAAMVYLLQYDLLDFQTPKLCYTCQPESLDEKEETAELVPCWKFTFTTNDPGENVFFPILQEEAMSHVSERSGYMLIDATSGDPADLDINWMTNSY